MIMAGILDLIKGIVTYSGLVGLGGPYIVSQFNFRTIVNNQSKPIY